MLMYSMSIYSWPRSLIKDVEKWIRNLIWSGDVEKRKLVTVSWKKICRPLSQGGLNLRSLKNLNTSTNLNLIWKTLHSQEDWALLLKDRVFRNLKPIKHHIYSSLWSSMKDEFIDISSNTLWLLGNGEKINFWNDCWCGAPLSQALQIPEAISQNLTSLVGDYMVDGKWEIPDILHQMFPSLRQLVQQAIIPLEPTEDTLLWKHTDDGELNLKQAYHFKLQRHPELSWAKTIWNADIPPSKSLMVWRLMHNKIPTDENLMERGCQIPSVCNLCLNNTETSSHLFFSCRFAVKLWSWLASSLNTTFQLTIVDHIWSFCNRSWSPQCKITITAAIVFLLNSIWYARNAARFNNNYIHWKSAISSIISSTSLSGCNTNKATNYSISDFSILKAFNVTIRNPRAATITEVLWNPPLPTWIKCNTDGASSGNPGTSSCGGIFRNSEANCMGCFSEPLGVSTSFIAEMNGVMRAIEIAKEKQRLNLWVKTDSSLVVHSFNSNTLVPWHIRNRWNNILVIIRSMNCIVTHIYREGNQVADSLANYGLTSNSFEVWEGVPGFASESFARNKIGLPNFRFSSF